MNKRFLIALAVFILAFTGCGQSRDPEPEKQEEKKYTIGFSMCNLTIEYLAQLRDEILAYREALGMENEVEIIILDAMSDPLKQNSQVDNLISQKVDCILMIPFDRVQQVPAVEAAAKAGIPLVEFCASTISDQKTSYVGSEDEQSGVLLAQELLRQCREKGEAPRVVILHGPTGQNAEVMRHTGFQKVMSEEYPEAEIVAERNCEWDRSKALDALENLVRSGQEFNVILSENDEMAMGALIASEAAQKTVLIGGVDALPDALQAVKEGRLGCTVFQNAKEQSKIAFDVALQICKGEKVEKEYIIPYELVTKENADQYESR